MKFVNMTEHPIVIRTDIVPDGTKDTRYQPLDSDITFAPSGWTCRVSQVRGKHIRTDHEGIQFFARPDFGNVVFYQLDASGKPIKETETEYLPREVSSASDDSPTCYIVSSMVAQAITAQVTVWAIEGLFVAPGTGPADNAIKFPPTWPDATRRGHVVAATCFIQY